PPGTYTAKASDADRNCASASPANPTVTINSGGTTARNFAMVGTSNLELNSFAVSGNNGVINRNDCVNMNVVLKNNGCANATSISSTLGTTTPGVTVTQDSSSYPNAGIDATSTNATPFQVSTASTFDCG